MGRSYEHRSSLARSPRCGARIAYGGRFVRLCTKSRLTPVIPLIETTQEFFWDDLLEFIDERRVIPIVGAELVPDADGNEVPLTQVLATRLAERLRVPADEITGHDSLHQVVNSYVQKGGGREDVYPRLRAEGCWTNPTWSYFSATSATALRSSNKGRRPILSGSSPRVMPNDTRQPKRPLPPRL